MEDASDTELLDKEVLNCRERKGREGPLDVISTGKV